ncbi:MAG: efflux RND transporter permease subunit [Chromatiales bacterium]|nr:efflux RND transporter permease subunit [Chromatiales bacterium]
MSSDIRKRIEGRFEALGHLIYNNHWKALLLVLIVVASFVSQLPKLTMDTSTESFLHKDDNTLELYNDFRNQYGHDELIFIAIESDKVFSQDFLKKLQQLHKELENNLPYLDDITSLINARNTRGAEGELIVEDLLENWPEDEAALMAVKQRAMSNPLYRDMMLSADGTITTIVLKADTYTSVGEETDVMAGFDEAFDESPADSAPREFISDGEVFELVTATEAIVEKYKGDDFRIHTAGSPPVVKVLKTSMQENMRRFVLMSIVAISLLLFVLFRRLSGVALPILVVILTLLSTLGMMGMSGIAFKLPTQILPSFLLAVGVGASVHILSIFFHHLQNHQDKESAIAHALGHSGLAVTMTSLTTAAGLASFAGADVAPVGELGLFSAIGIVLSLIYTLILLPALLSILPVKAKQGGGDESHHERMDRILTGFADIATGHTKKVLLASLLIFIVGIVGATQVKFSHKPFEWIAKSEPVRQATDFVNERMGGASNMEVEIDTGKENGLYDPKIMAALDRLREEVMAMERDGLIVGKTLSLADILKEIHQALNENRAEFYTTPDDRQLIAQELLLFENSGSDDLEDFVDSQFSKARFSIKMPWGDAILYRDFITDLEDRFRHHLGDEVRITVTGMNALLSRTMSATIVSMAESYIIAAIVITLMMILLLGSVRIGLISMIPNLLPIVLTLGLMGWLGLPLDLFTMLIGSIAIGLAVDDTIHFMHNYRRYHLETGDVYASVHKTLLSSGRAMLITTIVLATGFFLYLFSTMSNLFNFGLLTGFTIIMALFADFLLAPALMAQLHKSHLLADKGEY